MRACNVDFQLTGSRVPSLADCLIQLNKMCEFDKLTRVIEAAVSPRDFAHEPERAANVLDYLNQALLFDGFELQRHGINIRLATAGTSSPVMDKLTSVVETISFDTVQRDIDRALSSVKQDPEDAVTAACSAVESVCRSILVELGEPLPAKKDVQGLYNAVKRPLGLSPERTDLATEIAFDVRTILGGLNTIVNGIGALRTHAGDAHGREKGFIRIDGRVASLALHSASTVALFLIETWQKKYPDRALLRH